MWLYLLDLTLMIKINPSVFLEKGDVNIESILQPIREKTYQ